MKKHAVALELLFWQVSVRISSISMAYSSGKKTIDILATTDFINSFLTKKDAEAILSLPVMLFALKHIDLYSAPGWWSEPLLPWWCWWWGGGEHKLPPQFLENQGLERHCMRQTFWFQIQLIWGGVGGGWTHPQDFLSCTRLEIEIADFYRLLFQPFLKNPQLFNYLWPLGLEIWPRSQGHVKAR